jgi:hypothetical protein
MVTWKKLKLMEARMFLKDDKKEAKMKTNKK